MTGRVKRTYNLSEQTVHRVRELADRLDAVRTQDAVIELAVDRLYAGLREQQEADEWAAAAIDQEFRAEMSELARDLGDGEAWPR